jgi:cytochrome c oxidase subunit 2
LDVRLPTGKIFALLLAGITLVSVALFASHRWWMPQPASQHAPVLDAQFNWTLINTGIAFVLAQSALAFFVWKFRAQNRNRIKGLGNGVSIAMVIAVVFISLELFGAATLGRQAWASMYSTAPPGNLIRVQAMGQQFAFYFRYPGPDGQFGPIHVNKIDASVANYFGLDPAIDSASRDDVVTTSLVLPVNRPVELVLEAQDVIHSFYVRELRIQQDMVPGMHIPVRFTPTKIGIYEIACTQLCGLGHYRMRAKLQVMSEAEFQKWMQAQARP